MGSKRSKTNCSTCRSEWLCVAVAARAGGVLALLAAVMVAALPACTTTPSSVERQEYIARKPSHFLEYVEGAAEKRGLGHNQLQLVRTINAAVEDHFVPESQEALFVHNLIYSTESVIRVGYYTSALTSRELEQVAVLYYDVIRAALRSAALLDELETAEREDLCALCLGVAYLWTLAVEHSFQIHDEPTLWNYFTGIRGFAWYQREDDVRMQSDDAFGGVPLYAPYFRRSWEPMVMIVGNVDPAGVLDDLRRFFTEAAPPSTFQRPRTDPVTAANIILTWQDQSVASISDGRYRLVTERVRAQAAMWAYKRGIIGGDEVQAIVESTRLWHALVSRVSMMDVEWELSSVRYIIR